eukprot:9930082-Ditylum_brightwellii.AAC.1
MQGDHSYCKTKITHPLAVQLGNFARNQLPKLSVSSNQVTLPAIYQNKNNEDDTSTLSDPYVGSDNESTVTTEIVTGKHKRPGQPKKDDAVPRGKTVQQLQQELVSRMQQQEKNSKNNKNKNTNQRAFGNKTKHKPSFPHNKNHHKKDLKKKSNK